ncbi:MAG: SpoIID/LytB domain-containing protein, partial [Chloroflexi bacterium]|nr:SpoIID/LytB domain-containing protein [Chloroflexota bacterium]
MYRVDQRVVSATWTTADFEMIPEHPTAEQQAAIDAVFLRQRQAAEAQARQLQTTPQGNGITIATIPIQEYIGVLMSFDPVIVQTMVLEEDYLKGVVPAEMPASWPAEALKAQAVAARSYAVTSNAYPQYGAQVDTTTRTQAWTPNRYATTDAAVDATRSIVASYGGAVAHTLYFAGTKDGYTRNNEDVFSGPPTPYLRSVWSPDAFGVWKGHGVGMSQYGARSYASNYGANFADIVAHYYTAI